MFRIPVLLTQLSNLVGRLFSESNSNRFDRSMAAFKGAGTLTSINRGQKGAAARLKRLATKRKNQLKNKKIARGKK